MAHCMVLVSELVLLKHGFALSLEMGWDCPGELFEALAFSPRKSNGPIS